jgi:hypothetical protein
MVGKDFDGYQSIQSRITRSVDNTHAAGAKLPTQFRMVPVLYLPQLP